MSNYTRLAAGENILLEKQNDVTFIHCTGAASPQKNLHSGFFQLQISPLESSTLRAVIGKCTFRLNGKYVTIDDYTISTYYDVYNMIFLKLDQDPEKCSFYHTIYGSEEEIDYCFDHPELILLYKIIIRNNRMSVETFAAGGMIDTVYAAEGFLYQLKDGSIRSTATRLADGEDRDEFCKGMGYVYVPCFDPASGEGININIPTKGGALAIGKDDKFYSATVTGFPSSWANSFNVKINPEKIYI